jgi:osmotically-inducible protein OsmY
VARAHASINAFILSVVAAFGIAVMGACDNTARGVKQDAQQAETQTRDERAEAAAKARELGNDAARAANRIGEAANQAGEELAERANAAWATVDVKGALMADGSVDATRIDVDTDYRTKIVTLNGYVPTVAEQAKAEAIARQRAPGFAVINKLEVMPRTE